MPINQAPMMIYMEIPNCAKYLSIQGKWVPNAAEISKGVILQKCIGTNNSHRKIGAMTSVIVASIFMRT